MEEVQIHIGLLILELLAGAIGVYFFLRILPSLVSLLSVRYNIGQLPAYKVVKSVFWLFYILWAILQIGQYDATIAYGIFFLMAVVGAVFLWISLKDVLIGIIIRSRYMINVDEVLVVEEQRGIVTALSSKYVILENENGEHIHIPYSSIWNKSFTKAQSTDSSFSHTIVIDLDKPIPDSFSTEELRKNIVLLPWISPLRDPVINIERKKDSSSVRITLFAYDKQFFDLIEDRIRKLI